MAKDDRLEPLPDGSGAFRTEAGERWRHKDVEGGRVGGGYRLFIADTGEERRYVFGSTESHDATLLDLREQLARAQRVGSTGVDGEPGHRG